MAHSASSKPRAHAIPLRRMLSVNSWRAIRSLFAPNENRMAISRRRAVARASRRFATFAQAIKSKNPTAPNRTKSVGRMFPTVASFKATTFDVHPVFVPGYSCSSRLEIATISACAWSMLAPGFSRAITVK